MTAEEMETRLAELGWSQTQAAERLGVSQAAVSRWVSGQRAIPEPVSRLLAVLSQRTRWVFLTRKRRLRNVKRGA